MKETVYVTHEVEVEIDESKFTPEFMQTFRDTMSDFETIKDHIRYLAQLEAQGFCGEYIEGYGNLRDMGIKMELLSSDTEIA